MWLWAGGTVAEAQRGKRLGEKRLWSREHSPLQSGRTALRQPFPEVWGAGDGPGFLVEREPNSEWDLGSQISGTHMAKDLGTFGPPLPGTFGPAPSGHLWPTPFVPFRGGRRFSLQPGLSSVHLSWIRLSWLLSCQLTEAGVMWKEVGLSPEKKNASKYLPVGKSVVHFLD